MDFEGQMHEMHLSGLEGIAKSVKEDMEVYTVNVEGITQYGGGYYMYTSAAASMNDVPTKMSPMMQQVIGYMEQGNLPMAGMPFTIYNQIDEANNNVIFSTAVPVREKVLTPSGSPVLCGMMEPVTTIKTTLKGNYQNLPMAYEQAMAYLAQNNLTLHPTAPMFEVYATDPTQVPNPADWLTQVYIPIVTPVDPTI
jgi:hypothetical protein